MKDKDRVTIEQALAKTGKYVGPTVGISMQPMLKEGRDTVVVLAKTERLKPLDVALYKRGNACLLHRVLSVDEGSYRIRGDNCYYDEVVAEDAVLGVLSEFFRKNKRISCQDERYLAYAKKRVRRYKIRRPFVLCKRRIEAFFKKLFRFIFRKKSS